MKTIKNNNTERNKSNMFNKNQGNIVLGCIAIRIDNEKSKSQIMKLHLIFFFVGNVSKFLSQKASVTLSCHIYHVQ